MRALEKVAGLGRIADRGRLGETERFVQVQRAGTDGEGFFELPVDAQPFDAGGQSGRLPIQVALTGWWGGAHDA